MAYAMTKQGSLDNCITYEFICDTIADMNAIENRYRTLGSIAVVLSGESEGLEVYIAGSDKAWNNLGSMGASSSDSAAAGLSIYICTQGEYDTNTKVPTVEDPDETSLYLVPASQESGNLYDEYVYVNNAWEKFGGGSVNLSNYVQKTDIATQSVAGLVKVLDNGNVTFNEHNQLVLTLAGTAVVKSGQSDHPISVTHQHEAAFYGLAKAAGQDMKNSNNAVGTYTTEAATAIRNMIGAGTYNKPSGGIPASDIASGVIPNTSIYAPKANPEFTGSIGLGRRVNTTIGAYSAALGQSVTASGTCSHAEGYYSIASGADAHAEGQNSKALGAYSHAEGLYTIATGRSQHVSGRYNIEDDYSNWPEWTAQTEYQQGDKVKQTTTANDTTTIKGYICKTAHTSGNTFLSSNWDEDTDKNYAVIVGNGTNDHTRSNAYTLDWEGNETIAGSLNLNGTIANGPYGLFVTGLYSIGSGYSGCFASGACSYAHGAFNNIASGEYSHAQGAANNVASGLFSFAQGGYTNQATSHCSVAIGSNNNTASGAFSIAVGQIGNIAGGNHSMTIGEGLVSPGKHQCSLGKYNAYQIASSWVASTSYALDDIVIQDNKLYKCITANSDAEFTDSKWEHIPYYLVTIGNGNANARSNAYALDQEGNEYLMGDIYVGCNADSTGGTKLPRIPEAPSTDGSYILQTTVTNGTPTYTWVSLSSLNGVTF